MQREAIQEIGNDRNTRHRIVTLRIAASAPLSSAATPIVDARPPALPTARQLVPRPTGCELGRTGSARLGSVQSASTWQGPSAWRRSPLPSVEATASAVYRQLRLRASSGRSAPAGVTAVAPIGLRTSAARPYASSRAVPNGRGRASFQAVGMRRM